MNVTDLLDELRQRDVRVTSYAGRLSLDAPVGSVSADLLTKVREQKPILLEVLWRAEAMRQQLRPDAPIPLLVARESPIREGYCVSCGDPVPPENLGRCQFCVQAAVWVLRGRRPSPGTGIHAEG